MVERVSEAGMNCDGIAAMYEALERLSFGDALQRRRVAFLRQGMNARKALVCGDGDGRFLCELLRANRFVEVDYVDASARMAELAERRVARLGAEFLRRVRFRVRDIRVLAAETNSYDLVTAHFFSGLFCGGGADAGDGAHFRVDDGGWVVAGVGFS